MVLPFERQPLLHKRYANLSSPVFSRSASGLNDDSARGDEYATFLKNLSSSSHQDGGTSRTTKSPSTKQGHTSPGSKDSQQVKNKTAGGLINVTPPKNDGVVHVTLVKNQNIKEHQKKMKIIEDHMLQHKQEERELKRYEGDIVKKQHHLRRTMMDYENSVYKRKRGEESKLSENNQELEKLKQQHFIQEDKVTKTRLERNLSAKSKFLGKDRKVDLNMSEKEFQYYKVAKQLELARTEVFRLTQQFESKLKKKEITEKKIRTHREIELKFLEEEYTLKKSLAELAIAVNMEALKKRTMEVDDDRYKRDSSIKDIQDDRRRQQGLQEKLKGMSSQGVKHEYSKRRMSRDLLLSKDMLSLKSREEGRKMTDINRRLQYNSTNQKQAKLAAEYLELDRQGKEIEERGQFAEARRSHLHDQMTKERKQHHVNQALEWKKRFLEKQNEAMRKSHEDSVKHFQKVVNKMEENEHALYNRVRATEMQRRKQEQVVQRLSNELDTLKRDNAKRIKETQVQCQKKEVEMQQKLLREQAELAKAHNQREESIQMLSFHRARLADDKYILSEEEREHDRLARIGQRSDNHLQEVHS